MVVCLSRPSLSPHSEASEREPTRISARTVRSPVLTPPPPNRWHTRFPALQLGNTPLPIACTHGHTELALALVAKGANVDAVNNVRPWGGVRVGGRADRQMSGMDGGVSQPPLAPSSLRRLRTRANSYLFTYRSLTRTSLPLPPSPLPHRWHTRYPVRRTATHRFSSPVRMVSLRRPWRSSRRAPT